MDKATPPRRRWFQFGLWRLLVAIAAIAILLTQWPWAEQVFICTLDGSPPTWRNWTIAFNQRFVIALAAEVGVAVVWFLWKREQRFNRGEG